MITPRRVAVGVFLKHPFLCYMRLCALRQISAGYLNISIKASTLTTTAAVPSAMLALL